MEQSLADCGVEGQVVLGEDLPRQREVRRDLAVRHREIGGAQGRILGEALLDFPRDFAQFRLACGDGSGMTLRRRRADVEIHVSRIRDPGGKLRGAVARPLPGIRGQRDHDVRPRRECLKEIDLTATEELEAVHENEAGDRRDVAESAG